jgi:hypothetical protein
MMSREGRMPIGKLAPGGRADGGLPAPERLRYYDGADRSRAVGHARGFTVPSKIQDGR